MNTVWYAYFTEEVAARAREGELLQELVHAIVCAAADYDMYATGKADAATQDHESSYCFFREIIDKLSISPQAIVTEIDDCYPDKAGEANLTKSNDQVAQASTN